MKKLFCIKLGFAILFLLASWGRVQGQLSNLPPKVSLVWPVDDDCRYNYFLPTGAFFKIKADATDADGGIAQVQFFYDSNLIGIVSNAHYSMIYTSIASVSSS